MKDKIIARLKAKFSGVNLSNARLDAIADKLATKITDENQIDPRLDELNEISPFAELAKYDDWQRSKEAKEKADKEKADKDKADKEKTDKDKNNPQPGNDAPAWAKTLIEQNQALAQEVQELKSGRTAERHQNTLVGILKEKKVPESYYNFAIQGRTFKDDAELTTFANSLVESYTKFDQENTNKGLTQQPPPMLGNVTDQAKDVSPDMANYIKEKKAAEKKTA